MFACIRRRQIIAANEKFLSWTFLRHRDGLTRFDLEIIIKLNFSGN